jgi:Tol biopolymer transport system component
MKRIFTLLAVITLAALSVMALAQRDKEAETLFHRGVHFEEVRGELKEAIAVYEEIVKKYPENRPVTAKALYHLGLCYEKLGLKQAADAFQAVVERYPEQTETVVLAREKLAVLMKTRSLAEKGGQELKISLIWQGPDMDDSGEISPDNKYLSCIDWTTSDLAVREMATGKLRRLTSKEGSPPGSYEAPDASIWAPDSREIAYTWYGNDPAICELRLIALDGSKPRIVFRGELLKDWITPCDWSPDGRYILTKFIRTDSEKRDSRYLGLISVKDGSVHYLDTVRGTYLGLVKFSPDGRSIIYAHPQKRNPECGDISLLPLDGENATLVIEHPADDRLLGWTPDGRGVLFSSIRTGTWDAWMIPIVDGKAQGAPRLVKRNLGKVNAMGLTQGGSLYYSTPGLKGDIFSVSIDPDSGRLLEGPQKMSLPYEGNNTDPRLSPDGKHLVYISQREPGARNDVLGVFSLESGEAREIRPKADLLGFAMRDFMPDGRSVLLRGGELNKGGGFYKVDLQTGETTLLLHDNDFLPTDKKGYPQRANFRNISPDGGSFYYTYQGPDKFCRVMTRRLDSKEEKEICRFPIPDPSRSSVLSLSPDGLRLAVLLHEEGDVSSLKVFPVTGGEAREVHRFEQRARRGVDIEWSHDGRYIYFSKPIEPEEAVGTWEMWRVPAGGGDAQNLRVILGGQRGFCVHPDGKRIIFQSRTGNEQVGAIWVMENFLPVDKGKK